MDRSFMYMNRKTQIYQDVSFSWSTYSVQSQSRSQASYFMDIGFKAFMERQKTYNSQENVGGEQQSWSTDSTQP